MKIAFVNNQLQLGGAETVVEQLRAGAGQAGHQTPLYVAHGKTYPTDVQPLYPRRLSRLSHTRLHPFVERCFPRATWTDRAFRRLAHGDADVIHVHNFHGDYASIDSLAYVARRKQVVWTFHAFWGITGGCDHPLDCRRYQNGCGNCPQVGTWPVGPVDLTAEQWTGKVDQLAVLPLHVIAPSRYLANTVRASRVGRHWTIHQIPNGVNPARFPGARKHDRSCRAKLGLAPDATVILIVNRAFRDPNKGFPVVLEALTKVWGSPPAKELTSRATDSCQPGSAELHSAESQSCHRPGGGTRLKVQATERHRPSHCHIGEMATERVRAAQPSVQVVLAGMDSAWAAPQLPPTLPYFDAGYVTSREQLSGLFEAADIFLFASAAENFPCVILEAMAAECCVVATPTGGVKEQIAHRTTGLLSEEITGSSLAKQLREALAHPLQRRACGANARQRVEKEFSEERMVTAHLELYAEVVNKQRIEPALPRAA